MFRSITNKIKEKLLKLIKGKNTNTDIELLFDNANLVNEQEVITEEVRKELAESLSFIGDIAINMHGFDLSQSKKAIKLINKYIDKYRSEDYVKYAEVRECTRKLNEAKSNIELKMYYGEEKTELNSAEKQDLREGLECVEIFKKNINTLDNCKLEKVINIADCQIKKYSEYKYVKYDETRKAIRKLNSLKSDILIKMTYENEDEQEKRYLKCC